MIPVNDQRIAEFGICKGDMFIVQCGQVNDGDIVLAIGGIGHVVRNLRIIEDKVCIVCREFVWTGGSSSKRRCYRKNNWCI